MVEEKRRRAIIPWTSRATSGPYKPLQVASTRWFGQSLYEQFSSPLETITMAIPRSGSGRQYKPDYITKPKKTGYKEGEGKVVPIKTAKKNKNRKHTNDATYSKPSGGHEFSNVKQANLPMDNEGKTSRVS